MGENKICCFTGHRPKNLSWEYNERGQKFPELKKELEKQIKKAICDGYNYFITGMALGIDMLCAEIVIELQQTYSDIKLECAIPCKNQTNFWTAQNKKRYLDILNKANYINRLTNYNYFTGCMTIRNNYMLEQSTRVIAVFNGSEGGTKQTIIKAQELGKEVIIIKI